MLLLYLPPQMQGSVVRRSPGGFSSSLYASLSRRISGSVASQSINAPSPSPFPPSSSGTTQLPDPPLPTPLPLPSAARTESFRLDGAGKSDAASYRYERSEPSLPSIPGKFSKYSKPISKLHAESTQKRVERRDKKAFRKPMGDIAAEPDWNVVSRNGSSGSATAPVRRSSNSPFSTDELPDWMHHYQFSYSEVPTAPIIGFRQTPWSPFGPAEMVERPWTGSAPLKPSKKKRPEFDSFNPPPPGKKGVKYVQRPGPFLPGEGPKPAKTREEILGAPLTSLEIQELVTAVNKRSKQLNLGRDGLTHNMLDVVHSHWKRSVCCKIKCKGVPTLDMDNVARVVEEKCGGVVIHRAGGVMYVFRGRNYNYKDRPKIPIMLWKPPDPIYPRLIQRIPEGLTELEANQLRAKGRKVAPLCRLAKNGVYLTLVAEVRAQFKVDDVVRVDCQGMNATDYKKIGAKLKDLVPCILLSFEKEQIIMCRKKQLAQVENGQSTQEGDEKSIYVSTDLGNLTGRTGSSITDEAVLRVDDHEQKLVLAESRNPIMHANPETAVVDRDLMGAVSIMDGIPSNEILVMDGNLEGVDVAVNRDLKHSLEATDLSTDDTMLGINGYMEEPTSVMDGYIGESKSIRDSNMEAAILVMDVKSEVANSVRDGVTGGFVTSDSTMASIDDVDVLWQKAIDEGKAVHLDNQIADPDIVFEKAAELSDLLEAAHSEDDLAAKERLEKERSAEQNKTDVQIPPTSPFDLPSMGGLGVDELAKLLAP